MKGLAEIFLTAVNLVYAAMFGGPIDGTAWDVRVKQTGFFHWTSSRDTLVFRDGKGLIAGEVARGLRARAVRRKGGIRRDRLLAGFSTARGRTPSNGPATSMAAESPARSSCAAATAAKSATCSPASARPADAVAKTRIILFHKPYGVLSQFTSSDGKPALSRFGLPAGVYPRAASTTTARACCC